MIQLAQISFLLVSINISICCLGKRKAPDRLRFTVNPVKVVKTVSGKIWFFYKFGEMKKKTKLKENL